VNTASRYQAGALSKQNYFPFKVNGTGVMPVIFATSLLAVPPAIVKFANLEGGAGLVAELSPGGSFYLPLTVILIATINQFYTFLQFEPNDIAEQLKRGVRLCSLPPICKVMLHRITRN
jgi:preprotein translocase subunit SecY